MTATMQTNFTDEFVEATHRQLWQEAEQQYGDAFRVPKEEGNRISEIVRALHVLYRWQSKGRLGSPIADLKAHSILPDIRDYVAETYLGEKYIKQEEKAKVEKRADKYAKLEKLALEKTFHEFTTQDLVDVSGLGAQTITKWARSTGFFRSIGRGKWEARNPKEDRKLNA